MCKKQADPVRRFLMHIRLHEVVRLDSVLLANYYILSGKNSNIICVIGYTETMAFRISCVLLFLSDAYRVISDRIQNREYRESDRKVTFFYGQNRNVTVTRAVILEGNRGR